MDLLHCVCSVAHVPRNYPGIPFAPPLPPPLLPPPPPAFALARILFTSLFLFLSGSYSTCRQSKVFAFCLSTAWLATSTMGNADDRISQ